MVDTIEVQSEESIDPSLANQEPEDTGSDNGLILGKFKTQEDLIKSYQELEKKMGSSETANQPPSEDTPTSDTADTGGEPAAPSLEIPENSGEPEESNTPNFDEFTQELSDKGELSGESYKKLEKQGYSKNMVDAYIEGQKAIIATKTETVFKQVGGKDAYLEMVTWASENFSETEVSSYDKAINGSEYEQRIALNDLQARFKEANGQPNLIDGKSTGSKAQGFRSLQELSKAQQDPRYSSDPAYRAEILEKLKVSNI